MYFCAFGPVAFVLLRLYLRLCLWSCCLCPSHTLSSLLLSLSVPCLPLSSARLPFGSMRTREGAERGGRQKARGRRRKETKCRENKSKQKQKPRNDANLSFVMLLCHRLLYPFLCLRSCCLFLSHALVSLLLSLSVPCLPLSSASFPLAQ